MELTDDEINNIRVDGPEPHHIDKWNALCDMALAHNAAKRQEPVAWWNGIRIYDERDGFDGPSYRRQEDSAHDIPLYSAPNPCNIADLATKLKEARELLERVIGNPYAKQGLEQDIKHFLARTK